MIYLLFSLFSIQYSMAADGAFSGSLFSGKIDGSIAALFQGPTIEHLDANTDGKGSYYILKNYLGLGYEFMREWKMEAGDEFRQYFRPIDPKNKDRSDFEFRDPYLGISKRDAVRSESGVFTLGAKARYFFPWTPYNRSNLGKEWNEGNGHARFILLPKLRFMDGALSAEFYSDFTYRFAREAKPIRQDYYVRFRPALTYQATRKVAARVEYHSGDLNHRTNGKWTKFNDPVIGQMIYAGMIWTPTSRISINPQLGWGSDTFRLNRGQMSVYGMYMFL